MPVSEFLASAMRVSRCSKILLSTAQGLEEKLAPSVEEGQTVRHQIRKHVGVEHYNYADDGAEGDGVPKHETENHAFVAELVGCGGGHADGLRIHHFAHDTSGAVRGGHQNWIQVQLFGGDALQTAEQCVRGSVAAGQGHAQPS